MTRAVRWQICVPLMVCGITLWAGAAVAATPTRVGLWDIEKGACGWRRRVYDENRRPSTCPVEAVSGNVPGAVSAQALRFPVAFPGKSEFVLPVDRDWTGWQSLEVELVLPEGLPSTAEIYFFTKDWDHLWRQIRVPVPGGRRVPVRFVLPVAGDAATARWQSRGHGRPWHMLTPGQLLEFGCSFDLATGAADTFDGDILLTGAWLTRPGRSVPDLPLRKFGFAPDRPRVGEVCEFSFELHAPFASPFDPESLRVTATVVTPSGTEERLQGFYYEGFLYDPSVAETWSMLMPYGVPCFKVRYTPRHPGAHTVRIETVVGDAYFTLPETTIPVQPAAPGYKGFVRVDETDPRFLEYDSGAPFWGIGLNVRSPFDTRYLVTVPYSQWTDEGLPLYERLFKRFAAHGIDVVEVWMSSWWLALEWIDDAPGFHGVGYMNQYRAWMLDQIVTWAEENGIYLILVFNNHGKFGALNDTEWARNPYNRRNGGFLDSCEDFFTDARAKQAFRNCTDYILARWGCSPRILMWKLFTEIDLTGTSYEFYKQPVMSAWHREMGAYVKQRDLYKHPVTTHWMLSYSRINAAVGDLPELDILTTDAYYQDGGTRQLMTMLRGTAAFAEQKGKPVLVTEFGGSPHADSMGNLVKQAHLGIWTGFFCGSSVAPLFWWFGLVDEKDLYSVYSTLARYTEGENRRGMTTHAYEDEAAKLYISELRDSEKRFFWGCDAAYYFSDTENLAATLHEDFRLAVPGLDPGVYDVEYWDFRDERLGGREVVEVAAGNSATELSIPPFRKDFALKIRRR